jgi:hypothetical protein
MEGEKGKGKRKFEELEDGNPEYGNQIYSKPPLSPPPHKNIQGELKLTSLPIPAYLSWLNQSWVEEFDPSTYPTTKSLKFGLVEGWKEKVQKELVERKSSIDLDRFVQNKRSNQSRRSLASPLGSRDTEISP